MVLIVKNTSLQQLCRTKYMTNTIKYVFNIFFNTQLIDRPYHILFRDPEVYVPCLKTQRATFCSQLHEKQRISLITFLSCYWLYLVYRIYVIFEETADTVSMLSIAFKDLLKQSVNKNSPSSSRIKNAKNHENARILLKLVTPTM